MSYCAASPVNITQSIAIKSSLKCPLGTLDPYSVKLCLLFVQVWRIHSRLKMAVTKKPISGIKKITQGHRQFERIKLVCLNWVYKSPFLYKSEVGSRPYTANCTTDTDTYPKSHGQPFFSGFIDIIRRQIMRTKSIFLQSLTIHDYIKGTNHCILNCQRFGLSLQQVTLSQTTSDSLSRKV